MEVGTNVEVGSQSSSDDGDTLPEYTLQPGCSVPVEGNRPIDYFSLTHHGRHAARSRLEKGERRLVPVDEGVSVVQWHDK
jgi:hypothetical protein